MMQPQGLRYCHTSRMAAAAPQKFRNLQRQKRAHLAQGTAFCHTLRAQWQADECAVHGLLDVHASPFPAQELVLELVHQLCVLSCASVLVRCGCWLKQAAPLGVPYAQAIPCMTGVQLFQRPDLYARLIRWLSQGRIGGRHVSCAMACEPCTSLLPCVPHESVCRERSAHL